MRRKKIQHSPWSLGSIPLTPVENKSGFQTRSQFYAAEAAAEKERQEAPVKQVLSQVNQTWQKLNKAVGAFWAQSISDLAVANLWQSQAGVDLGFSVPKTRDSYEIEVFREAFESWFEKYNGPHQFALGTREKPNRGAGRLVWYAINQAMNNGQDMSNPAAFDAAHARLVELGSYGPDEIAYDASKLPAPQPAPEPAKPSLEEISVSTEAGRRQAAELLNVELTAEYQAMYDAWAEHLIRDYKHWLTDEQTKAAINWFRRNDGTVSMMRHEDWNRCRRFLVSQSILPSHMLTEDERLSIQISQNPVETNRMTFEDRRQLQADMNVLLDQSRSR